MNILIIEDNEKHIEDAKAIFGREIEIAKNLDEAWIKLEKNDYDGIISDIFFSKGECKSIFSEEHPNYDAVIAMQCQYILSGYGAENAPPLNASSDSRKDWIRILREVEKWNGFSGNNLPPAGVLVINYCIKHNIPVVMNTDIEHHGLAIAPVENFCRELQVPVICGSQGKKLWRKALENLQKEISQDSKIISFRQKRRSEQYENERSDNGLIRLEISRNLGKERMIDFS